ncbi:MAG: hypothetical protein JSU91_06705 [Thermoplasmatales archaeon]|nr:MAG: hypothetical protein JSU91_06705 [Thermoplasmatales archaeon]
MKEKGKRKFMPFLLTLILIISMITIMPTGTLAQEVKWYNEYDAEKAAFDDMTPGDEITVKGSDLTVDQRYYVYFEAEAGDPELLDDKKADDKGDVEMTVNVPFRNNLTIYQIYLLNDTWGNDGSNVSGSPVDVDITNSYKVRYKSGGEYLEYVLLAKEYYYPNYLEISVWNWTGAKYVIFDEGEIDITLYDPSDTAKATDQTSTGYWNLDYIFDYDVGDSYENNYWVEVVYGSYYAYQPLPVKLNMTAEFPSDPEWGDTITVEGYLYNGTGVVKGYNVVLLAPSGESYVEADNTTTYTSGRYSLIAPSDEGGASAGTWYVGTWDDGPDRIDETDIVNWGGFINYYSFEVSTRENAVVSLESPDEVITGFDQSLNISVYNTSWDDNYYYDDMWIHITGVETEWLADPSGKKWYDEDDIIVIGDYASLGTGTSSNEKYAYYEIDDIKFNETGKVEIIVTWDNNNTYYEDIDDLQANISGTTSIDIAGADDMNLIVEDMVESVLIDTSAPCCWVNESTMITLNIYGDDQDSRMNASIFITGCGLDIEIDEEDAIADGFWQSEGIYKVNVSPKTAGTLTITADNDTENMSVSKDFSISGLSGSITTSIGDDKEISVSTTETVILTVNYGQYANVQTCYYDKTWDNAVYHSPICLNESIGDNTAGNGLNGIFEFTPDVDDLDHVGFIVVVAAAGGNYMYEIIEVAPIHDLVLEIIDPDNESLQTLTCGLEHDWEFQVKDGDGNIVDDIEFVLAEVLDEDEDTVQEYNLKEKSGNIWYMDDWVPHFTGDLLITAWNNTGEDEHDGNNTFLIDCATIEYSPEGITAAIGLEDITVEVTGLDANGNPLPDGTRLWLNVENDSAIDLDTTITLDEDGMGEFDISDVGDVQQDVNLTFQGVWTSYGGNKTCGKFEVKWPNFDLNPDALYIGQPNTIEIIATDYYGDPIEGINLTLWGSSSLVQGGIIPDPEMTDANGRATLSVNPISSGKLNLTIVKQIVWDSVGAIDWDTSNIVVTDTTMTITSLKALTISVSKTPIWSGDTLTVTIKSSGIAVSGVAVTLGEVTATTDSSGQVTFTTPDPGVDSAIYTITAEKNGYITAEKSITVIKTWEIQIIAPSGNIEKGKKYTFSIIAKGQALAGATITFNGKTYVSDGEGKVSITMPDKTGDYTITATFSDYESGTLTFKIVAESPGFELLTLIIALGVALILLRRRRK